MTNAVTNERMRALNGPERVAALLLSVDKDVAQRVLKHFDQNELRQITKFAAGLGAVSASTIEPLIDDFVNQLSSGGSELLGTANEAEQLLTGVVPPDQVAEIMSDVLGSPNHLIWERVSNVPDAAFVAYVANEHPQTAALILSKVDPSRAAKMLGALPDERRNALIRRMFALKPVSDAALRLLETTIQQDLLQNAELDASTVKNAKLAAIINKMERDHAEGALRSLSEVRPRQAEALKGLLFTFEDVAKLDTRGRTILFDLVSADRVILALRGAEPELREFVLSSLSSRVRRMVESELSSSAAPPKRDIAEARRSIAQTVLKLAEQGKIDLASSTEEDEAV